MSKEFYQINRPSKDVYEVLSRTETEVTLSLVRETYVRTIKIKSLDRLYTRVTDLSLVPARPQKKEKGKSSVVRPAKQSNRLDLGNPLEWDEDESNYSWSDVDDVPVPPSDVLGQCHECKRVMPSELLTLAAHKLVLKHLCGSCRTFLDVISIEDEERRTVNLHS